MEESAEHARWRQQQLNETEQRWAEEQRTLRARLITHDDLPFEWPPRTSDAADAAGSSASSSSSPSSSKPPLRLIGGVDLSFVGSEDGAGSSSESGEEAVAALVVLRFPDLSVVWSRFERVHLRAPYISGFLAFREASHLLRLLHSLRAEAPELMPQALLVDGNGVLHHRGFGLASHLGVLADMPTIGLGKNLLLVDGLDRSQVSARAAAELRRGGESFELVGQSGAVWGACLRATDASPNPVFVSIGHRFSLSSAVQLVHACSRHRIAEPVRQADLQSRDIIRQWKAQKQKAAATAAAAGQASTSADVSSSASGSSSAVASADHSGVAAEAESNDSISRGADANT